MDPATSSEIVPETLLATGISSTEMTVKVNEVEGERDPSVTVTPIVDEPLRFAIGTTVSVQFGAVPPLVTLDTGEEEVTLTEELQSRLESTSEMVKLTTLVVSSFVVWAPMDATTGASFTAEIVMEPEAEFEVSPLAVTV